MSQGQHRDGGGGASLMADWQANFNIVLFLIQAFALPLEVFMVKAGSAGGKYFTGTQAFVAIFLLMGWGAMFNLPQTEGFVWLFILLYIFGLLVHRIKHQVRMWRGEQIHSYYVGDYIVRPSILFPGTLMLGALLLPVCPQVGTYIWAAVICKAFNRDHAKWRDRAVVQAMVDQQIEAEHYASMFRERMGER
jgi:phosphatidylserine synthase